MSKVKEIYEYYKNSEMIDEFDNWEEEIQKYALSSKSEKQNLIELFEKEEDVFDKMQLAEVLANLQYKGIVNFLKSGVENRALDKIDRVLRYQAAISLLKLGSKEGFFLIENYVKTKKIPQHWIATDLSDIGTLIAIELLLKLANKFKDFAELIDRSYFENKLKSKEKNQK